MDQPAIAIGQIYVCGCETSVRRVTRLGDRGDGFVVENFRWSGVVLVAVFHECDRVETLPPMSGSGGRSSGTYRRDRSGVFE
jgi:hypothetical protein